jgi:hypothetical protein
MDRLTKAQAQAIQDLVRIQEALVLGSWAAVRDAAIKLAALAADRAAKEQSHG